jgi:hypothetical protein
MTNFEQDAKQTQRKALFITLAVVVPILALLAFNSGSECAIPTDASNNGATPAATKQTVSASASSSSTDLDAYREKMKRDFEKSMKKK